MNIINNISKYFSPSVANENLLLEKKIATSGKERRYFLYNSKNPSRIHDLFIFFHGLEGSDDICLETKNKFSEIGRIAKARNFISIFPVGLRGSLPEQPTHLGWVPQSFETNVHFVARLIGEIRKTHQIRHVIIGGFSNGAYFASQLFNENTPERFKGYWMQGGGYPIRERKDSDKGKIVVEIGKKDEWHFDYIKSISSGLKEKGWVHGSNIRYRELDSGHTLELSHLEKNLDFLSAAR